MTLDVRRVVTGHERNSRAVVRVDDSGANRAAGRANQMRQNIWSTDDLPVTFGEDGEDKGACVIAFVLIASTGNTALG